jgi:hypothetical protein
MEDKTLEQGNHFKYLGYEATFLEETDTDAKIQKFQNICGTIRRTLKGKTRKDTQIKFYQVMAVTTLLYGSECWAMRKRDTQEPQAAETRFLRSVKRRTGPDKIRNEDTRKELGVFSINDRIRRYRQDWLEHVERTEEDGCLLGFSATTQKTAIFVLAAVRTSNPTSMEEGRMPKQALWHRPKGRRDPGRPRRRWHS